MKYLVVIFGGQETRMFISKKFIYGLLILLGTQILAAPPVEIEWSEKFSLPPQPDGRESIGLGVPFYGEHNGMALLAGGSNFPINRWWMVVKNAITPISMLCLKAVRTGRLPVISHSRQPAVCRPPHQRE